MITLTEAEKDKMARLLALRATAAGWFFIGMVGFLSLVLLVIALSKGPQNYSVEFFTPIGTILLFMLMVGSWLLRRRHLVRRLFEEPLELGNGRIMGQRQIPYLGNQVRLKISSLQGEMITHMGYLGQSEWEVGDKLELILWANGRFCPRHIEHAIDFGYLPTPERKRTVRRRIITAVVLYLFFVALAILMGLYGQGRL